MSMLRCFFEIGADSSLFDGLYISQKSELCEKYMGQFPVISISLKSVEGLDFEAAKKAYDEVHLLQKETLPVLQKEEQLLENSLFLLLPQYTIYGGCFQP